MFDESGHLGARGRATVGTPIALIFRHMKSQLRTSCVSVPTVTLILLAGGIAAQGPDSPPFRDEQRITAIDLMVQVVSRGGDRDPIGALPAHLAPEDFEVAAAGEPRPVISVSAFGPAQHLADHAPWNFVLYFDRSLTSPYEAGWAAGELVAAIGRLTDLGRVEVVVADPEPRTVLEPTRDAELLGSVLAEIALFPEGDDHELLKLRDEFLAELAKGDSEIDPAELAAFAIAEEARLVRRQLDGLVTWLAGAAVEGPRRVVFLANAGFDLDPQSFYRPALARHGKPLPAGGDDVPGADLAADVDVAARSLAAYGWIVFPLVPPPDTPPTTGLRIGKWQVGKPRGELKETPIDPLNPHDTVTPVLLNFLNLKRESNQDRDKAESYLEFGTELAGRGELVEAEQALRMAIVHFAENPNWEDRRALTLAKLGEVLDGQGRRREAREAYKRALELAPDSPEVTVGPLAELTDPLPPVDRLAADTTGKLVRGAETLDQVLAALPYRVRVSFQLADVPEGTIQAVAVRCLRRGCELAAPAWARNGTPDEVATARLRRWLADDQYEGALEVKARLVPASGAQVLEVEVAMPDAVAPAGEGEVPKLRATLGFGDPESVGTVKHLRPEAREDAAGRRWSFRTGVSAGELPAAGVPAAGVPAAAARGVAVVVEHLESGAWGGTVVELADATE